MQTDPVTKYESMPLKMENIIEAANKMWEDYVMQKCGKNPIREENSPG